MSPPRQPEPEERGEDQRPAPAAPPAAARARRPYRTPRVIRYGRLAELTEFGGSQVVDSGNNLGNLQ
jgi:hypothetical protein